MFRLETDEAIESGIKRILVERIDDSLTRLSDPAGDLDLAVHDTRKNFKMMRAVLRLVRDALGEEVYRAENACYRDASRQLAALRDSAVLVETLDQVKKHNQPDLTATAFNGIRRKLVERQEATRYQLLEQSDAVAEVIAVLTASRERVFNFALTTDGAAAFEPGIRRVYRRGRRRMARAYTLPHRPERFHDWRKRVKYLWHHAEIFELFWPEYMTALARELKLLSKYLGDSHDLVVLEETLMEEMDVFGHEADLPLLMTLLAQRQVELEEKARPVGERLYVEPARVFARRISTYWRVGQVYQFFGVPETMKTSYEEQPREPSLASTTEVAEQMGISVSEVRNLIRKGELPAFKVGQTWAVQLN